MLTVATINLIAVFFAFLESKKIYRHGLKISFLIIFLFSALRYEYGNDYIAYRDFFEYVNGFAFFDYSEDLHHEIGWSFFNRIFYPFGFFTLVAFLSLITCFFYYKFFKKYIPVNYYWFSVFFYVFNPESMLIQFSSMRQTLAIVFFITSLHYIYEKKLIHYLLSVIAASFFHTSVLVLSLLYFLRFYKSKLNKTLAASIFFIFICLILFGDFFRPYLEDFLYVFFHRYSENQEVGVVGSGLGFLYAALLLVLILLYERFQTGINLFFFKLAIVGYFVLPLGLLVMMIGRIGMYFQPILIVVYTLIAVNIKNQKLRGLFLTSFLLVTIFNFYRFFHSEVWSQFYSTYQTIFSAPYIY